MTEEQKYDFRSRMREYYLKKRRNMELSPAADEVELDSRWQIVNGPHFLEERAGFDLKRFLEQVMDVPQSTCGSKKIVITSGNDMKARPGCTFKISDDTVEIRGVNPKGALFGVIRLEDLMRMREAPFLKKGEFEYTPSPGCAAHTPVPDWMIFPIGSLIAYSMPDSPPSIFLSAASTKRHRDTVILPLSSTGRNSTALMW